MFSAQEAQGDDSAKFAVMGIGNILFKDEGLGVYAAQYLQANYEFSPAVDLIDGGTMGMNMIHTYQRYQRLIILDTISVDAAEQPGAIYCLNADVLQGLGHCRKTAHEIEVLQTLELGALAGDMADIQIIAMVPEEINDVSISLSQTVLEAMPMFVETILAELSKWGVQAALKPGNKQSEKEGEKESEITFHDIISQYNQQQAFNP